MSRPDPVGTALSVVRERFPSARAAWLGGSVARGEPSPTSDLDVTVLLAGPPAPFRESLLAGDWPVELFVHDEDSLRHYRGTDQDRRQPTLARLVGEAVVLLDRDGSGERLGAETRAEIAAGPRPLTADELASARYTVTDLLDDLAGARDADEALVVAAALLAAVGGLALTGRRRWTGTGKGLLRELHRLDGDEGLSLAVRLPQAVRAAGSGAPDDLVALAEEVLAPHGGRLFAGHRLAGTAPSSTAEPR